MAGRKADRIDRLVSVLDHANSWVTGAMLAKILNISERSVRSYVAEVNDSGMRTIESSKEGYRIARAGRPVHAGGHGTPASGATSADAGAGAADGWQARETSAAPGDVRCGRVISRLVNAADSVSIFDLADELFISESTLSNSVLPSVRRMLAKFDLTCEVHGFNARITGREQDKRKLLGYLAMHNDHGYFTSTKTLEEMFPNFDIRGIQSHLVEICQRSELFINDYALNNLLVHLLVIIIRLTSNNELGEPSEPLDAEGIVEGLKQRDAIMSCANRIAHYFENEYGCTIPAADFQQIILLITLSIERYTYDELDIDKLASIMDRSFVDTVLTILDEMGRRYNIPQVFDDSMLLQLILHMFNAYQRAVYHVSYPNPLAAQIKQEYAPIYDMAVYIVHRFSTIMNVEIGENEIAFIAFHIGAYFERASTPEGAATCIVIVEEYHDFARQLVEDLRRALEGDVNIIGAMNCDSYLASPPDCDVVITTIDVPVRRGLKVLIGPILTKQNLRKIRAKLADVLESKRRGAAWRFLRQILRPELYARNVALVSDPDSCIDYLGSLCMGEGLVRRTFIDDVHLREQVSSTAFTDCVAIPHAINESPEESFIAVLHNDAPIPWGRHNVHFVLLIGIAEGDMRHFRDALDIIIELFSSVDQTMRLLQTDSFDAFKDAFTQP